MFRRRLRQLMRWAIVGFGDIAEKAVAPAILHHPSSELVAICRRSQAKLNAFGREFQVGHTFTTYQEMLDWGEFDAVYVASPVDLHASQSILALEGGFHVIVEKPMALSGHQAEAMVNVAAKRDMMLGIAYYHRFTPINLRVREIVSSGQLGELVALHANASSLWRLLPSHPKYWRVRSSESGGGPLVDVGTHRIDLFQALAGPAQRVAGFVNQRFIDGDVEDACSAIIEYRSGVQATLSSLWCINPGRGDYEVLCTEGQIRVPDIGGDSLFIRTDVKEEEILVPADSLYDLSIIERFVDATEDISKLELSGEVGLEVQRITDAVYESASSGSVVEL